MYKQRNTKKRKGIDGELDPLRDLSIIGLCAGKTMESPEHQTTSIAITFHLKRHVRPLRS